MGCRVELHPREECLGKCRKREPLFATLASPPLVAQGRQATHVVRRRDLYVEGF